MYLIQEFLSLRTENKPNNTMQNLPTWYKIIQSNKKLKDLGFNFFNPEKLAEEQETTLAKEKWIEGKIFIGKHINIHYQLVTFWWDEENPNQITVAFGFLYDEDYFFIYFALEPKVENLENLQKYYFTPHQEVFAFDESMSPLSHAARLRKAEPMAYTSTKAKKVIYYLGYGPEDAMQGLENRLVMNSFLGNMALCMATAEGVAHEHTQHYTQFSKSIFTLFRLKAFGTTFYYGILQYYPVPEEISVKTLKIGFLKGNEHLIKFPNDMPVDILAFFFEEKYALLEDKATILAKIAGGDVNSALVLAGMTLDEEFEEVFLPFASNPHEVVRNFVAEEAEFRGSKVVWEAVKNFTKKNK